MKRTLTLLFFCLITSLGFAQRWDVGVSVAGVNYLGDIGGVKPIGTHFVEDMQLQETGLGYGAFARFSVTPLTFLRLGYNYGEISGDDALSGPEVGGRFKRNLSFRNRIHEINVVGERAIIDNFYAFVQGLIKVDFRFYIFGGVAYYFGNPQGYHDYQWHDLAPLKTEGQDKPYKTHGVSLPGGIGLNYTVYHRQNTMRYGVRCGIRKTFTDYLDDVSTKYPKGEDLDSDLARALSDRRIGEGRNIPGTIRGNPIYKDAYVFLELSVSLVLGAGGADCGTFQKRFNKKRRARKYSRGVF